MSLFDFVTVIYFETKSPKNCANICNDGQNGLTNFMCYVLYYLYDSFSHLMDSLSNLLWVCPICCEFVHSAVSLPNLQWFVSNLPWVEISFCPSKYFFSEPTGSQGSHFLEPCMWGGWTFCQNFSSLALTVWDLWCLEYWEEKDHRLNQWINESMNDEGVSRTVPATPGL